jgi:hypothetical protein
LALAIGQKSPVFLGIDRPGGKEVDFTPEILCSVFIDPIEDG